MGTYELLQTDSKKSLFEKEEYETAEVDKELKSEDVKKLIINEDQPAIDVDIDVQYKQILKKLISLSIPVILTYILGYMPAIVNVIIVGPLGEEELAAVTLGSMFCNVTGFALGLGLASGMDTLCSQAWGSGNKLLLGEILQKALVIELLSCIPVAVLWIFAKEILMGLGQDEVVADLAASYCQIMLIGIYPFYIYESIKKYLQAQGIVYPSMWISLIANLWTILSNWFLVYRTSLGYYGAPIARTSSHFVLLLLSLIYVYFSKSLKETWGGWSKKCFHNWKVYLLLAVPSTVMLCFEWWAFEILSILAGIVGTSELAAHSVLVNTSVFAFFFPYGISTAACIMIGNSLGEGKDHLAKITSRVILAATFAIVLFNTVLIISLRSYLPFIFTHELNVIKLAKQGFLASSVTTLFDGIANVAGGILRGSGKQNLGAYYNFFSYYVVGIPLASILTFVAHMDLIGLWIGLLAAMFSASLIAMFFIVRMDWTLQVQLAQNRVNS